MKLGAAEVGCTDGLEVDGTRDGVNEGLQLGLRVGIMEGC